MLVIDGTHPEASQIEHMFIAAGTFLFTTSEDGTVCITDLCSNEIIEIVTNREKMNSEISINKRNNRLVKGIEKNRKDKRRHSTSLENIEANFAYLRKLTGT